MASTRASGELIERDAVSEAGARFLDSVAAGRGGALIVIGEAGLGKTAALAHLGGRASGSRVGAGRGDPMETTLPFGLLSQAFHALGGREILEQSVLEAAAASRAATFYRALRWLEEAATQPVTIVLDDLHWADDDSLSLLSFLCRRIEKLPVGIIGGLRPWPSAAHDLGASLAHDGFAELVRLKPLTEKGAQALLEQRAGRPVGDDVARRAWALCDGNPLLLEQLAVSLQRGDDMEALPRGGVQLTSGELVLARFAGLPDVGVRCAQAASVLGTRFRPAITADVAGLASADVDDAFAALSRSGLVRPAGGTMLEFTHPLFGRALYDDMSPARRSALHARAMLVLYRRGLVTEAAAHAPLGDLPGDPLAIEVLEAAAREALGAGAMSAAITHLSLAVDLAGNAAPLRLLIELAEALFATGRLRDAVRVAERALRRPDLEPADRVRSLVTLGRALASDRDHERAGRTLEEAAAVALAQGDTAAAVEALLDSATTAWMTLGPSHGLASVRRAHELSVEAGVARLRAEAVFGFCALLNGDASGVDAAIAAGRTVLADPATHLEEFHWSWGAVACAVNAARYSERFDEALDLFVPGIFATEQLGAVEAASTLLICYIETMLRLGRLRDGNDLYERMAHLVELVPTNESFAGLAPAYFGLLFGDVEQSVTWCERVEVRAAERGEDLARLWVRDIRGQEAIRAGHIDVACAQYDQTREIMARMGYAEPCIVLWARHATMAYTAAGRLDDAAAVVDWLEACSATLPCRWPRIAASVGRALIAERRGDVATAEAQHAVALALHDGLPMALEHIETLTGYGTFLRRHGRPIRARPLLAHALRIAEEVGSPWFAEHCASELAIAGGRRERRGGRGQGLTAQELRVARLVATGLSNREVAARLFLSVNTIEAHLKRIYSKLGVDSRTRLMALAAQDGDLLRAAEATANS